MNTFSNNTTLNGWRMPGSGTWVTQDVEDFYVDENGDLWMPCFCGEGEGEDDGALGRAGEPEGQAAAEEAPEPPEEPKPPDPRPVEREPGVVYVNRPACFLYYPGRTVMAGGARHAMGMLADSGKGGCWAYRGVHGGELRLRVAHANMTSRMAVREGERVVLTRGDIYPGLALRYAVILENRLNIPAAVAIKGQAPFDVAPGSREWLYLGPRGFLRDESGQGSIAPGCRFEAALDMELSERLTVLCGAYHDKAQVDFHGRVWAPSPGEADPDRALFVPS